MNPSSLPSSLLSLRLSLSLRVSSSMEFSSSFWTHLKASRKSSLLCNDSLLERLGLISLADAYHTWELLGDTLVVGVSRVFYSSSMGPFLSSFLFVSERLGSLAGSWKLEISLFFLSKKLEFPLVWSVISILTLATDMYKSKDKSIMTIAIMK